MSPRQFVGHSRLLGLQTLQIKSFHQHRQAKPLFCDFYILFKLHKPTLSSSPITSNTGWITADSSRWMHQQLFHVVMAQPYVLQNTPQLCELLGNLQLPSDLNTGVLTADFTPVLSQQTTFLLSPCSVRNTSPPMWLLPLWVLLEWYWKTPT